jgi:hypothetical protein
VLPKIKIKYAKDQAQNVQKCEKEKKVTNISFIFAFVLYS